MLEKVCLSQIWNLRTVFNTLTGEFQYSRRNMCNFPQQLPTQLSHKRRAFSGFFIAFPKCTSSLEHPQMGMNFLAEVFPKLLTPQEVVTSMYKSRYFRTLFGRKSVSEFETLLKSARHRYYRMFPWVWDKYSWKKSVLVRREILGLFVNTLTAEYQYSRRNI